VSAGWRGLQGAPPPPPRGDQAGPASPHHASRKARPVTPFQLTHCSLAPPPPSSPPSPPPPRVLGSYAPGDPVESWLHSVLCLDASTHLPQPPPKLPHPSECDLFFVERDTLFSFHK
jgi:hypothetical protein